MAEATYITMLGELGEELTARGMDEELVSRVILDLAAQGKEAE